MKPWQVLLNKVGFIKQSTHQGRKGTNYVFEPPPIARSISKKEREGHLK